MFCYRFEDKIVLKLASRVNYLAIHVGVLLILLALSVQIYGLIASNLFFAPHYNFTGNFISGIGIALFFLIASGYIFLLLLSFFLLTQKISWKRRLCINLLFFTISLAIFLVIFGTTVSTTDFVFFICGLFSVIASDVIASVLASRRT